MQPLPRRTNPVQPFTVWLDGSINPGFWRALLSFWIGFLVTVLPVPAEAAQDSAGSNLVSIAELQSRVDEQGRAIESFQIEGVVCAIAREKNAVVLQDTSATAFLE